MKATNGLILKNGQLVVETEAPSKYDQVLASLPDDDREYITSKGSQISLLTSAEDKLMKKKQRLEKHLKESKEGRELADIKVQLKFLREQRREITSRVTGVLERASGRAGQDYLETVVGKPKALNGRSS